MNTDYRPISTVKTSSLAPDLGLMLQKLKAVDCRPEHPDGAVDDLIGELDTLLSWLNERIAQADALLHVAEQVAGGMLLDDVLDRIYVAFKHLIPYDRIGCALLNGSRTKVRAHWARTEYGDVKIGSGFTSRMEGSSLKGVMTSKAPRIINDLEAYLTAHPGSVSTKLIVAEGVRSSLTCPLIAEDRPLGFLFFSSREKDTYREVHQETFLRIAGQVSLLVERSRLVQRVYDLNRNLTAAHSELIELSRRDSLTGLLNHGAIVSALSRQLSCAEPEVSVLMIDVDRFKQVNDDHGHVKGDEVLCKVAAALARATRENDTLGRYGGEEFLAILPGASAEQARLVAQRMRRAVSESVALNGIPVTVSIGVADSRLASSAPDLVAVADAALYRAKELGRDRVVVAPIPDEHQAAA